MKKQILSVVLAVATMLIVTTSYAAGNASSGSGKGYIVHSVIDGHQSTTAYNKRGKWIYTIQQYSHDNLDKNIIDIVKTVYDKYDVTGIQKVEQPGMDTVYVVHLENTTSVKIVRICNDELELVQDFFKR